MRRVEVAFFFSLTLSACEKTATPYLDTVPSSASATSSESVVSSDPERLVRIVRFDCAKFTSDEDAANAFPMAQSLRNWMGGGPGGAAWNADRLRCAAELQTPCTEGSINIELHVGNSLAAEQNIAFSRAGMQAFSFDLRDDSWAAQLNQVGEASKQLPYRSAVFVLAAVANCTKPEAFGPGIGPRLEYADQDSFLAGFASGE
ncbi:hypothetical protein [Nevskia sp.]|uniref:hypothetical protein n=1 Tax=Nevskia sp. TaxID=1929292 RepID=UPI0025F55B1F|nr:hypothetical protein [Nevskia sp.]